MSTKELYTKGYFRASWKFQTNKERLDYLIEKIKDLKPKNILDVGCGRGYLIKRLNEEGIEAWGVDFAEWAVAHKVHKQVVLSDAKKLPFPDKLVDLIISTDFFEHVPEEEVDVIYREMKRVGNRVAAVIAFAEKKLKINAYHVTVKSKEWWESKLPKIIWI